MGGTLKLGYFADGAILHLLRVYVVPHLSREKNIRAWVKLAPARNVDKVISRFFLRAPKCDYAS